MWLWGLVTDSLGAAAARKGGSFTVPLPRPHPQPRGMFLPASCPTSQPIFILLRTRSPHSWSLSAKLLKLAWVLSYMEGKVLKPLFYRLPETRL